MKRVTLLALCAAVVMSGCVAYPDGYRSGDGRDEYRGGQRHDDSRGERYRDQQRDHDHFHNGRADG
jgi:hypothetical protein